MTKEAKVWRKTRFQEMTEKELDDRIKRNQRQIVITNLAYLGLFVIFILVLWAATNGLELFLKSGQLDKERINTFKPIKQHLIFWPDLIHS